MSSGISIKTFCEKKTSFLYFSWGKKQREMCTLVTPEHFQTQLFMKCCGQSSIQVNKMLTSRFEVWVCVFVVGFCFVCFLWVWDVCGGFFCSFVCLFLIARFEWILAEWLNQVPNALLFFLSAGPYSPRSYGQKR